MPLSASSSARIAARPARIASPSISEAASRRLAIACSRASRIAASSVAGSGFAGSITQ